MKTFIKYMSIPALVSILFVFVLYMALESENVRITGKDVKSTGVESVQVLNKSTKVYETLSKNIDSYFVYTNNGAYVMEDNIFYFRLDSSDQWGKLEVGKDYNIQSIGVRFTWFSIYENIIYFEEIPPKINNK